MSLTAIWRLILMLENQKRAPSNNRYLTGKSQSLPRYLTHGLRLTAPVKSAPLKYNCTCIFWTLWTKKFQNRSKKRFLSEASPDTQAVSQRSASVQDDGTGATLLPAVPGFQWCHEAQVGQVGQEVLVAPTAHKHKVTDGMTQFSFFFFFPQLRNSQRSINSAPVADRSDLRARLQHVYRSSWGSLECKNSSRQSTNQKLNTETH